MTPSTPTIGHEREGTRVIPVAVFVAGVVAGTALTAWGIWWLAQFFAGPGTPTHVLAPVWPPYTRHWIDPTAELRDVRERENAHLDGYAWIDRSRGVVSIPIERAMELIAHGEHSPTSQEAPHE